MVTMNTVSMRKKAFITHCRSSTVACSSRWMPGRMVLTMVKSMKTTKLRMLMPTSASQRFGDASATVLSPPTRL